MRGLRVFITSLAVLGIALVSSLPAVAGGPTAPVCPSPEAVYVGPSRLAPAVVLPPGKMAPYFPGIQTDHLQVPIISTHPCPPYYAGCRKK